MGVSSGGSDRGVSGARLDILIGLIVLGADELAVTVSAVSGYALKFVLRCSRAAGEES